MLGGPSTRNAVMILSFWTDRSGQTVQTQIRLLLEEQSDQGLHCLRFPLHILDALLNGKGTLFERHLAVTNFSRVQIFRTFTVAMIISCVTPPVLALPHKSECQMKNSKPIFNDFGMSRCGIKPRTSRSLERTLSTPVIVS